MNSNDKHAIRQLFDEYLRMHATRIDSLQEHLSEDSSGFTCADDFLARNAYDTLDVIEHDCTPCKESPRIELKELIIQSLADSVAVTTGLFTVHQADQQHAVSSETAHLVLIFRKESSGWAISQSSMSIPTPLVKNRDAAPLQALKERNHILARKVVEQSKQLSELNDALQAAHGQLAHAIDEQRQTQDALRKSQTDFRMLTENAVDVVWRLDSEYHFTYISPADEKRRGYRADEVLGHHVFEMFDEEGIESIKKAALQRHEAQQQGKQLADVTFEARHRCKNGRWIWGEIRYNPEFDFCGNVIGFYGISREITERKQMQEHVCQLAFYDPLTALPNRHLFNERLSQAMAISKRKGSYGALMFLDLDNFKPINDTHGHTAGDLLLVEVAKRLKGCVRETDTIARFGGDEFIVVLSELNTDQAQSAKQAQAVAEKIRNSLAETYRLSINYDGKVSTYIEHSCTVSIGIALFRGQEMSLDELLKRADSSMYKAKENGRNAIKFYNSTE